MKRWTIEKVQFNNALRLTLCESVGGDVMRVFEDLPWAKLKGYEKIGLLVWLRVIRRILLLRMKTARLRLEVEKSMYPAPL